MNLSSSQIAVEEAPQNLPAASAEPTNPLRVLVIGATGFIGSRILRALKARTDTLVSILARGPATIPSASGMIILSGDLKEPASLLAAVRNADVVINAASYVGSDPALAWQTNFDGTLAVIRACKAMGIGRLVQVSTTAVYGTGPHQEAYPWELPYHPESAVSESRAAADQAVLAAGGVTVRPNLVYGVGDRWFIPGTIRMLKSLGTMIEDGDQQLSIIDVNHLGSIVAGLATTTSPVSGAFHAAHPEPVTLSRLISSIDQHIVPLAIEGSSSVTDAVGQLRQEGYRPHQVHMLGKHHHYNTSAAWTASGAEPGPFLFTEEASCWYRGYLLGR
ncbi:NAD(P)-dependent oxidoreductase [Micrococcaceae bacterium Sec5.1]